MTTIILNAKQVEVLEETGINPLNLDFICGQQIHKNVYINAWTDGYYLVFIDQTLDDANAFIYYLGTEKEAELEVKYAGLTIFSGADEDITNYISSEMEIKLPE